MPSKSQQPKKSGDMTSVEKKRQQHPVIYILSFILLIVIVVAFVGTPIISRAAGSGAIVFGEYDNRPIEYVPGNYFARQRDILADQLASSGETGNLQFQVYQVWRNAFRRTAFHLGVLDRADESGLYVTEDRVDQDLTEYPGYMENGEFSELRYRNTPNSEKFAIRKLTRENIIQQQYIQDVIEGQQLSSQEIEFVKDMSSPERKFRFVSLSFDNFPAEQVAAFGESHPDIFTRISLSRITVTSSESDAQAVLQQLQEGTASFEELARTHSQDLFAEQGGDMGLRYYYELQEDFPSDEALNDVFSLDQGEVSDVIETSFGWTIYQVNEAKQLPDFTNDETLSAVRSYMERFERGTIEDYLVSQAESFAASAHDAGFQSAADTAGYSVQATNFFPVNYGNMYFFNQVGSEGEEESPALRAAASTERFFRTAFALEQDAVSEPVIADEHVLVLQFTESREVPEEELTFITNLFPAIAQQYRQEGVERSIMTSPEFEDNFNEVYSELFVEE